MLVCDWAAVCDGAPTLIQHRVNLPCLLGYHKPDKWWELYPYIIDKRLELAPIHVDKANIGLYVVQNAVLLFIQLLSRWLDIEPALCQ